MTSQALPRMFARWPGEPMNAPWISAVATEELRRTGGRGGTGGNGEHRRGGLVRTPVGERRHESTLRTTAPDVRRAMVMRTARTGTTGPTAPRRTVPDRARSARTAPDRPG